MDKRSSALIAFALLAAMPSPARAEGPRPVTAATDQAALLRSRDPKLAAEKRLVYDFARVILAGRRLDQAPRFMLTSYIQHNPNVDTGLDGFLRYFSRLGGPRPIPGEVADLVSIQAEGNIVTLSFVNELTDGSRPGGKYTTTWFDMFRVQDGKIAEHWDCDTATPQP